MKIKIGVEEAKEFFYNVKYSDRKQMTFSEKNIFYGSYVDGELASIVGVREFKNTKRITCFLTKVTFREKGIGSKLLEEVVKSKIAKGHITTFATSDSKKIFCKLGFEELYTNKYNVTFMEANNEI
ncbi:MAG: GNAT family N-acetyltransferase [Fusobacteriaceae bacterium]